MLNEAEEEEATPAGSLFVAPLSSYITRPAGEAFDFLGLETGEKLAVLPQNEEEGLLFLGAGADEIEPGSVGSFFEDDPRINAEGEYIRIELVGVDGPEGGNFFLYQTDGFGAPTVFLNTADGIQADGTPSDTLFLLPGGHDHYNWAFTKPGTYEITVQANAIAGTDDMTPISSEEETFTFFVEGNEEEEEEETPVVGQDTTGIYAVGGGTGVSSFTVYNADNSVAYSVSPFGDGFTGGVRVATVDLTGDGVPDVVAGTGPGIATSVKIINGKSQAEVREIAPFEGTFTGGVFVSAGDITGDGVADYVISPDEGGGPRVRLFNGGTGEQIADFFAIEDDNFRGGVRTALADVNGDGTADLIVAAGFGGGPRIAIFDGATLGSGSPVKLVGDFFAFEESLRNGAFVAVGDFTGDGNRDLAFGAGPGGGPRVLVVDGTRVLSGDVTGAFATPFANFFGGDTSNRGGIRIGAKDADGDGTANIIAVAGEDAGSQVTVYSDDAPQNGAPAVAETYSLPLGAGFAGGLFVG